MFMIYDIFFDRLLAADLRSYFQNIYVADDWCIPPKYNLHT